MLSGRAAGWAERSAKPPNIFVSAGDGPKVTVSIASDKMNTRVSLALPSGSGKYDVIAGITDIHNRGRQLQRCHLGQPSHLCAPFHPGARLLRLDCCDKRSGLRLNANQHRQLLRELICPSSHRGLRSLRQFEARPKPFGRAADGISICHPDSVDVGFILVDERPKLG
jgi:hypothetical protein